MHFVLVHGWGFNGRLWADLVPHLPDAKVSLVDLGFVAGGPDASPGWPADVIAENTIAVGHSFGVLWFLKQGLPFKGLISIQGFDRYCPHVPPSRVAALKRGLARDAHRTLQAFWRSCGAPDVAGPEALNVEMLDEGLDWLMHWDAEGAKKRLRCPILTLGGPRRRDRPAGNVRGGLGRGDHPLVARWRPCPTLEAPRLVRPSCP